MGSNAFLYCVDVLNYCQVCGTLLGGEKILGGWRGCTRMGEKGGKAFLLYSLKEAALTCITVFWFMFHIFMSVCCSYQILTLKQTSCRWV